ncbi:MAG: ATP-dependent RNA helicase RhlE [uncultured Acidimicrobiales bacterium]|uniref:ATP-dependent RNA helicase RhlE n=1 Tax=uncultured Acidimicrobiales bacterium TaxID=310071 RepID=A0A6J4I8V0_9ACTN|nr:MAG: ATP-dependent RNA helicase RhlE [uncultured Acidimicrobiales bacterium]
MPTFADLGVPSDLLAALERAGVTDPFPIQTAALPDALAGRDVCGRAPTGSGKTLAYGLAAIARIGSSGPRRPTALVLVPTRELAAQVTRALMPYAQARRRWVTSFYGGMPFGPQLKALARGVDIAVACPGRLRDLVERGAIDLSGIEVAVVDEADRMADLGFLGEVQWLLDQCPQRRQVLLFSATLDGAVDDLVKGYQTNPVRHELPEEKTVPATQLAWRTARHGKLALVAEAAKVCGPTIVFCRTRLGAEGVAERLVERGTNAVAIHGDKNQAARARALADFSYGRAQVLVATDVAARGIHVDGVACVIHLDLPDDPKDHVHRSGRTARAGSSGVVITLVAPGEERRVKRLLYAANAAGPITNPDMHVLEALDLPVFVPPPEPERRPRPQSGRNSRNGGGRPHRYDGPRQSGPRLNRAPRAS